MNKDRTTGTGDAVIDEPGLTETNSRTIRGEDLLANDAESDEIETIDGTSTRTKLGVIPTSYGADGGIGENAEE